MTDITPEMVVKLTVDTTECDAKLDVLESRIDRIVAKSANAGAQVAATMEQKFNEMLGHFSPQAQPAPAEPVTPPVEPSAVVPAAPVEQTAPAEQQPSA